MLVFLCEKCLNYCLAMAHRLQLVLSLWLFGCASSWDISKVLDSDDECQSTFPEECSLNALQLQKSDGNNAIGPCDGKVDSQGCTSNHCMFSCKNFFGGKNYLSCPLNVRPLSFDCRQYGCSYNCGTFPGAACKDDESVGSDCEQWAASGECSKNPGYMHVKCKASCGLCFSSQPSTPQPPAQSQPQPQYPSGWCTALFGSYGFSPSMCKKSYGGSWYQWICSSNSATYFCDSSCNHCNH